MVDESLFNELKESLENSRGVRIELGNKRRKIERIIVISDGMEEYKARFEKSNHFAERLNAEIKKIFLYDIESFLTREYSLANLKESDEKIIEVIKDHSSKIKELKEDNISILIDKTTRDLLYSSREMRNSKGADEHLSPEEVGAITEFLLGFEDRSENLANSALDKIVEYNPQIVYYKPPILKKRGSAADIGFNLITERILKGKPSGTWVYLKGDKDLSNIKNATLLILGGQDISAIIKSAYAAATLFPDISGVKLNYLILLDKRKTNLASLVSNTNSPDELKLLLTKKMGEMVADVRIAGKVPEMKVVFGEMETDLPNALNELNSELVFISPKFTSTDLFDDEIYVAIVETLKIGASILVTY